MDKLYDTPIKAIRKKCLDCSGESYTEVKKCPVVECTLWVYRFGKRPTHDVIQEWAYLLKTR